MLPRTITHRVVAIEETCLSIHPEAQLAESFEQSQRCFACILFVVFLIVSCRHADVGAGTSTESLNVPSVKWHASQVAPQVSRFPVRLTMSELQDQLGKGPDAARLSLDEGETERPT